jgi:putative hydrolase of the HAD superfamily
VKYNHLFFDLDHTLWDFDSNAKEALIEVYLSFELASKNIDSFEIFYENYLVHNAHLWSRYEKGFITTEELKWRRMWRTLLDFKIADEQLARDMAVYFLERLPTKKKVFDFTYEILDYLTEKNYSMHLITNGFEKTQWLKLNNSGLAKYFKNVITSELANASKPKKEIFEFAIQRAHCEMKNSIMIGDNLEADIEGAQNAGMDTIFVNHIHAECVIKPTYIVNSLKELENIF